MKHSSTILSSIFSTFLMAACGTAQLSQESKSLQVVNKPKSETFSCTGQTSSLMGPIGPVDEMGIDH